MFGFHALEILGATCRDRENSKSEVRNPKQIQSSNAKGSKQTLGSSDTGRFARDV